jgi:tripartite-type tricarboxylate transporter receptor subunit TctC
VSRGQHGAHVTQGLPPRIQAKLNQALRDVLLDPAIIRKLKEQVQNPGALRLRSWPALLADDLNRWKTVVTTAKVSLN